MQNQVKTLDKWPEIKVRIKKKWSKIPQQDLDVISGNSDELTALLEKHLGMSPEDAKREVHILSEEFDDRQRSAKPGPETSPGL